MRTSLLRVRVESSLKEEASALFERLGIDISTAVRVFLKRSVMENGLPFSMTLPQQPYDAQRGLRALHELGDAAKENGTSDMTLEEINAEIDAYRHGKQAE